MWYVYMVLLQSGACSTVVGLRLKSAFFRTYHGNEEQKTMSLSSSSLKVLGDTFFRDGNYHEAVRVWHQALQSRDCNDELGATLRSNLSAAHMKLGDARSALEQAELCVSLRPRWAKAHMRLGSALVELGRFSEAHVSFRSVASNILQFDVISILFCAQTHEQSGEHSRARKRGFSSLGSRCSEALEIRAATSATVSAVSARPSPQSPAAAPAIRAAPTAKCTRFNPLDGLDHCNRVA